MRRFPAKSLAPLFAIWHAPVSMSVVLLALSVLLAYAVSLWWLLRTESAAAIAALIVLTAVGLCVRIWYTNHFPSGLIEDEPKMLRCAMEAAARGQIANWE